MTNLPLRRAESSSELVAWRRQRLATRAAMVSMLALLLAVIGLVAGGAAAVRADAAGLGAIAAAALVTAALVVVWATSVRRGLEDVDREIALQRRAPAAPRGDSDAALGFRRARLPRTHPQVNTSNRERRTHERIHPRSEGSPGAA